MDVAAQFRRVLIRPRCEERRFAHNLTYPRNYAMRERSREEKNRGCSYEGYTLRAGIKPTESPQSRAPTHRFAASLYRVERRVDKESSLGARERKLNYKPRRRRCGERVLDSPSFVFMKVYWPETRAMGVSWGSDRDNSIVAPCVYVSDKILTHLLQDCGRNIRTCPRARQLEKTFLRGNAFPSSRYKLTFLREVSCKIALAKLMC